MPAEAYEPAGADTLIGDTLTTNQAFVYNAFDLFDYFNDASSMLQTNGYEPVDIQNISYGDSVLNYISSSDAPVIHQRPQAITTGGAVNSVSWNATGDECIIELNEDSLYRFEDQLVTFILPHNAIRDEAGNAMGSDLTFEMLVDRNPLKWAEEGISLSEVFDSGTEFTSILNVDTSPRTLKSQACQHGSKPARVQNPWRHPIVRHHRHD